MGKSFLEDLIISFQENLVYVIGAGLAVLFVLLLTFTPSLFQGSSSLSSASVDPRSGGSLSVDDIANRVINKNLREDQAMLDLRAQTTEDENRRSVRGVDLHNPSLDLSFDLEGVDPNVYDGSSDVYDDIYGGGAQYDSHLNPKDRIEAKLHRLKMMEEYDFQQKLVFIKQFIVNAYEAGYAVEVNDHLEVVNITEVDPVDRFRGSASIEALNKIEGNNLVAQ